MRRRIELPAEEKKRGRPPGSTNKVKIISEPPPPHEVLSFTVSHLYNNNVIILIEGQPYAMAQSDFILGVITWGFTPRGIHRWPLRLVEKHAQVILTK